MRPANADFAGVAFDLGFSVPRGQLGEGLVANGDFGGRDGQADGAVPGHAQRRAADARRGFGQTIGFGQVGAGDLLPAFGDGLVHRRAATDDDFQRGEIELVEAWRVHQPVEQRIDAGQDAEFPLAEFLDEAGQVARVGDEQDHAAPFQETQRRGEAEDVVHRQRCHGDLAGFLETD